MKKPVFLVILTCLVVFFFPKSVYANDYIDRAVEALQTSRVFVYSGVPGTDQDTAGRLENRLRADDNVVLVMLPEEALADTDILTMAEELSEKLDDSRIIGLAVGRDVIGYAPNLPTGVAADQMRLAKSVSNDPITALNTFVKNIHMWLDKHPQPTFTPLPTSTPEPTATPVPLSPEAKRTRQWSATTVLVVLALVVLLIFRKKIAYALSDRGRKLNHTRNVLMRILRTLRKIRSERIRSDLNQACVVGLGLIGLMKRSREPKTYAEEKLPLLVANMEMQIQALIQHESGTHPLSTDVYNRLREVLLNYDVLFARLQEGSPEATDLLASIIESNNAMIESLGYMPEEHD